MVDSTSQRRYGVCVELLVRNDQPTASDRSPTQLDDATAAPTPHRIELHRTLLGILRSTFSHRDIASLVRDVADRLRTIARSNRVAIVLHDPVEDVMRLFATAGTDTPE